MLRFGPVCAALIAASLTSACANMGAGGAASAPMRGPLASECRTITEAEAQKSAGVPTVNLDGSPIPNAPVSTDPNDAIAVRAKIPRSPQAPLTASQKRIRMCEYELDAANEKFPYSLFVPTTYSDTRSMALIVDLHGSGVTPLQQMLFDGTTDFAERDGYIVVTPMGYNTTAFWGAPRGTPRPIETADVNPATGTKYSLSELSDLDTITVIRKVRAAYNIDPNRIYLMGHSMGGFGTYYLGARYSDMWAGLAPIAGGGINATSAPAEKLRGIPMLVMHGAEDPVVRREGSRNSVIEMQKQGMQHIYLEFPGKDHEFWIRRGRENLEKVFMFFNLVSKTTNLGPVTPEMNRTAPPVRPAGQ